MCGQFLYKEKALYWKAGLFPNFDIKALYFILRKK